jgi:hypothetical protein
MTPGRLPRRLRKAVRTMNNFPSKAAIEARKARYTPGARVELVNFSDPYSKLKPGDRGTVNFVDDAGGVHTAWDNGEGLAAIYGVDEIRKLTVVPPEIVDLIRRVRLLPGVPNMLSVKELFEFAMQADDDFYPLCDYLFMHTSEYSRFILSGESEF